MRKHDIYVYHVKLCFIGIKNGHHKLVLHYPIFQSFMAKYLESFNAQPFLNIVKNKYYYCIWKRRPKQKISTFKSKHAQCVLLHVFSVTHTKMALKGEQNCSNQYTNNFKNRCFLTVTGLNTKPVSSPLFESEAT